MNEIFSGSANQLIEPANSGDKTQLVPVSQQPRLYFDVSAVPDSDLDPTLVNGYVRATQMWMRDVWRFQQESVRAQSLWAGAIIELGENVSSIQEKLDGLTTLMERVQSQRAFVVPLTTLGPDEPLQMRLNIPATIEGDGDDFTATFTEANVSASGDTEADAIANLKASIVATYELLESIPASDMAPVPARQWDVLRSAIAR